MNEPIVERLLRRDRAVALAALVVIGALAWAYVLWMAQGMSAPASAMQGMDMRGMAAPAPELWDWPRIIATFGMWFVMMIAMMLPSAAPVILLYARVARSAEASGKVFAPTVWFLSGYGAAWAVFSVLATAAQYVLARAALIDADMSISIQRFAALFLVAAGLYQWTPLKDACLSRCRAPMEFIQANGGFRPEPGQSLRLGVLHGLYCIGCCWMLMTLLFVGGVMNLLWIAGLAALVLAEKNLPGGLWIGRIAGALIAVWGAWMLWPH